jgi:hypothetical protein
MFSPKEAEEKKKKEGSLNASLLVKSNAILCAISWSLHLLPLTLRL